MASRAVELVQARLSGRASLEEHARAEPAAADAHASERGVVAELERLDLCAPLSEVEFALRGRLEVTRSAAVARVVAWELEEEMSASSGVAAAGSLHAALESLESRLCEIDAWLRHNHEELERAQKGMAAIVTKNNSLETQRNNLSELSGVLGAVAAPSPHGLALRPATERALREPVAFLESCEAATTGDATGVTRLQTLASFAEELRAERAARPRFRQYRCVWSFLPLRVVEIEGPVSQKSKIWDTMKFSLLKCHRP